MTAEAVEDSPGRGHEVLLLDEREQESLRIHRFLEARGFRVVRVSSDEAAYNVLDKKHVDVLVTEIRGTRIDGVRLLKLVRRRNPGMCVILLAGPHDEEQATRALHAGAFDFQIRPVNLEKMEALILKGVEHQRLEREVTDLTRRLDRKFGIHNILGSSGAMNQVFKAIREVAPTDAWVLIAGAAGTGKELVASVLHQNSPRQTGPFVKLSCEALADEIMEAELFGRGGGDPSAGPPIRGRLEIAGGGTLFLDDVECLGRNVQTKLRHILGGERRGAPGARSARGRAAGPRRGVDVRLIAATRQDLAALVEEGLFDADLFHLLGARITLPLLRERRMDIPELAAHFLEGANAACGTTVQGFTRRALDRMTQYDWPGNVRELKNMVSAVARDVGAGLADLYDLPLEVRSSPPPLSDLHLRVGMSLKEIERLAIQETLSRSGWNRRQAARVLGIGLRTLYRKIKEYGLCPPMEEPPGEPVAPRREPS